MRGCLALLVLVFSITQLYIRSSDITLEQQSLAQPPSIYYLPSGSKLKLLSLDFEEVLADILWVKAVIYFAEQFRSSRDYRYLGPFLETITDLDPRFTTAYIWGGTSFMYNGQRITKANIEKSTEILQKGWRFYQESLIKWTPAEDFWRIPFMIGFNYAIELRRKDLGAPYIREASKFPGVPKYIRTWASTLFYKGGQSSEALDSLDEQLTVESLRTRLKLVENPTQRNDVMDRISLIYLLDGKKKLDTEAIEKLQKRRGERFQLYAEEFDYVPFSFFSIIYQPTVN